MSSSFSSSWSLRSLIDTILDWQDRQLSTASSRAFKATLSTCYKPKFWTLTWLRIFPKYKQFLLGSNPHFSRIFSWTNLQTCFALSLAFLKSSLVDSISSACCAMLARNLSNPYYNATRCWQAFSQYFKSACNITKCLLTYLVNRLMLL